MLCANMEVQECDASSFFTEDTFNQMLDSFLKDLRERWPTEKPLEKVHFTMRQLKDSTDKNKRRFVVMKLLKRLLMYHQAIMERKESFFRDHAADIKILKEVDLATKMSDPTVPDHVRTGIWDYVNQLLYVGCHVVINAEKNRDTDPFPYNERWASQCQQVIQKIERQAEGEIIKVEEMDKAEAPRGLDEAMTDMMKKLTSGNMNKEELEAQANDLLKQLPPDIGQLGMEMAERCQKQLEERHKDDEEECDEQDPPMEEMMDVIRGEFMRNLPRLMAHGRGMPFPNLPAAPPRRHH